MLLAVRPVLSRIPLDPQCCHMYIVRTLYRRGKCPNARTDSRRVTHARSDCEPAFGSSGCARLRVCMTWDSMPQWPSRTRSLSAFRPASKPAAPRNESGGATATLDQRAPGHFSFTNSLSPPQPETGPLAACGLMAAVDPLFGQHDVSGFSGGHSASAAGVCWTVLRIQTRGCFPGRFSSTHGCS